MTSCLAPAHHTRRAAGERARPSARLLLADDHNLVRESLRRLVESDPALKVVVEAWTGDQVVEKASQVELDLLVLDVVMPGMSGLEAVRELRGRECQVPVLFLTSSDCEGHFFEALALGALGYVHKSVDSAEFLRACHRVLEGQSVFLYPSAVDSQIRDHLLGVSSSGIVLSPREIELVRLVASGYTSREIGEQLYLSAKTIERYRSKLLEKLGLKDRLELCRYAIREGIIKP